MSRYPDDPRGLLLTEARIDMENATHISMQLRVEKAWLNRNLPFLTALMNIAIEQPHGHDPNPPETFEYRRVRTSGSAPWPDRGFTAKELGLSHRTLRARLEIHEAQASRRARSMTEAA
jgi:hypothetical protein